MPDNATPVESYSIGGWLVAGLGGCAGMIRRASETGVTLTAEKRDELRNYAAELTELAETWPNVQE